MGKSFVVWDDKFSIGVETVDDQHKGLFAMTNDLYEACMGAQAAEYFKEVLQKAVSYIAMHFGTEEKIMQETKDPNYEEHRKEHDLFVREVMQEASRFNEGDTSAAEAFMNFLRGWVLNHVTVTDIKIGQHIAQLKSKGLLNKDKTF